MNNGDVGGSRGRGRGWQQNDNQPRELRRPKTVVEVEPSKSKLSADAKEWYPPNYVPQPATYTDPSPYRPQRFSVQSRLRQAQDVNPYSYEEMSFALEEFENADLRENLANLITVMCEITFEPGKFDTLCGPLVDSFVSTLHDVNYTRPLVEAIVNQSIAESNFRYNGARLCSMYDSVSPPEESKFRSCLLERCAAEENKIISGVETSEENMRGFAMFLAEIYTQLEDSQGGRLKSLGESLCKVLLHLLDTDKEINIKAVCQLLKLSGIALDADCPTGMHAAFERLRKRSSLPCVRGVVALRAARWGLTEPDREPQPPHNPAPQSAPSAHDTRRRQPNNIYNGDMEGGANNEGGYLADGHTLTAEECAFLQSNLPPKAAAIDEDILDELENDAWETGMDAEMQAGFLEFLKMSNQIKR
ncbi:PREDICTED: polyadenylate-binding protein-interacting protein 1 [Papilio xuthus]|uniref:Polyadenylate-binding protein-interacting protein 1 n=1 Tax=Papilio xuthus TaxID=66420 RepID=A0A194PXC0_PAPXU|nr:PREDICTED: polyadenylate-binding protein-interacting protein 1 [Papilio xuthus]KPI97972.1 Polyadenylate-binding protein-interacting protein 1 [Papilio xuthus]